jgi:hypothetical protein
VQVHVQVPHLAVQVLVQVPHLLVQVPHHHLLVQVPHHLANDILCFTHSLHSLFHETHCF